MERKITRDTAILTAVSLVLQLFGLLLNIFITRKLGESEVGILSLISSFYCLALSLAGGNSFAYSSRFISEEIGGNGNCEKIMLYCLFFGVSLSTVFSVVCFFLADSIAGYFDGYSSASTGIRIMALSLPLAVTGACVKGYFHARRKVSIPCISELIEFIAKAVVLVIFTQFILSKGYSDTLTAVAVSVIIGEVASCAYLCISYAASRNPTPDKTAVIPSFFGFVRAILPIVASAYSFVLLSGANEALVPITLMNFSGSSSTALGEYGIFEGIIMPVLYFPSVILQSLSCILIPEIARETSSKNIAKVRKISCDAISNGISVALLSASFIFTFGEEIAALTSDNPLVATALKTLCPVIPFIYLELILEGILKGLGKQNFSTLNSAAEYIIRISCVLIFVRLIGFYGIVVSYFASNIACNIARIFVVHKEIGLKFSLTDNILIPCLSVTAGIQLSLMIKGVVSFQGIFSLALTAFICVTVYFISTKLLRRFAD